MTYDNDHSNQGLILQQPVKAVMVKRPRSPMSMIMHFIFEQLLNCNVQRYDDRT